MILHLIGRYQQEFGGDPLPNALYIVVDEISHNHKLHELHNHNPLSNIRLEGFGCIIQFLVRLEPEYE
jgi:hypothetical protein